MLGHKTSLNTLKKIEIISSIFSDHNGKKTRNQLQEENWKIYKYVEIKQYALEQTMGKIKWKEKAKNILRQMKMKAQHSKTYGMQQK